MKTIEQINAVNNNYDPIVSAVQRQWAQRDGAAVYDARIPERMADLADLFNANLPTEGLGPGVCKTCNDFITTYGALVYHDRQGNPHSAIWNPKHAEPRYQPLFDIMAKAVLSMYHTPTIKRHDIDAVRTIALVYDKEQLPFQADFHRVGAEERGGFHHLYLDFAAADTNLGEQKAEFTDSFNFLMWFTQVVNRQKLLRHMSTAMHTHPALQDEVKLHAAVANMIDIMKNWREPNSVQTTAEAMVREQNLVGFARGNAHLVQGGTKQLRGGSAAVFFDGIPDPEKLDERSIARYVDMTSPGKYKRITREFNERQLLQAEAQLKRDGLTSVLERRSVRKDDVLPFIWKGITPEKSKLTTLAGLKVKGDKDEHPKDHKLMKMSWQTFISKYAGEIRELYFAPLAKGNYTGVITTANPEAKEIFFWPGHMAAWLYIEGSSPSAWNLQLGKLTRVAGIMKGPEHGEGSDWIPFFPKRHLLVLAEGFHNGAQPNCLWKEYMDPAKFDYKNLANVLAATTETHAIPMDEDGIVAYSITEKSPLVVLYGEFNKIWTRFEIATWE
jgi:hypothetical protein